MNGASMKQQQGGLLLGLVIGVVVGLALALAVAVYITKVPVPFLNKGQTRNAEQDAAEAVKNKDWDPNAPLYGKPAPGAAAASAPSAVEGGGTAAAPLSPAPQVAPPAVTGDPLGDLARARAGNAAPGSANPFLYFIQAGAYRSVQEADAQRAKLALMGLQARVTERELSGRTMYRVRVGPFEQKDEADALKERLESNGLEAALVRQQR
jgi:cell division protein FtsN